MYAPKTIDSKYRGKKQGSFAVRPQPQVPEQRNLNWIWCLPNYIDKATRSPILFCLFFSSRVIIRLVEKERRWDGIKYGFLKWRGHLQAGNSYPWICISNGMAICPITFSSNYLQNTNLIEKIDRKIYKKIWGPNFD